MNRRQAKRKVIRVAAVLFALGSAAAACGSGSATGGSPGAEGAGGSKPSSDPIVGCYPWSDGFNVWVIDVKADGTAKGDDNDTGTWTSAGGGYQITWASGRTDHAVLANGTLNVTITAAPNPGYTFTASATSCSKFGTSCPQPPHRRVGTQLEGAVFCNYPTGQGDNTIITCKSGQWQTVLSCADSTIKDSAGFVQSCRCSDVATGTGVVCEYAGSNCGVTVNRAGGDAG